MSKREQTTGAPSPPPSPSSHRHDGEQTTAAGKGWSELFRHEPRLVSLLAETGAVEGGPGFCANAVWYGDEDHGLRGRVSALVGWDVEDDDSVLGTRGAYDLAYDTVYDALPCCRHNGPC